MAKISEQLDVEIMSRLNDPAFLRLLLRLTWENLPPELERVFQDLDEPDRRSLTGVVELAVRPGAGEPPTPLGLYERVANLTDRLSLIEERLEGSHLLIEEPEAPTVSVCYCPTIGKAEGPHVHSDRCPDRKGL